MNSNKIWLIAADTTLFLHVLVVCFVVGGLLLVFAGKIWRWHWVKNPWFRLAHLAAILVVVLQSWFGVICPLTTLENWFRRQAGDAVYSGSFISHWMERLLYYDAPQWIFIVCYTVFGLMVIASWYWVRPRSLFR